MHELNILIKNEPDNEVGGISKDASNTKDLQLSLIKEELDDDTIPQNDIVIIDDDTDAELDIDDESPPLSSTENRKNISKEEKARPSSALTISQSNAKPEESVKIYSTVGMQ